MGIGKRIASLVEQKGINLRQLAIQSGVPYNTVYAIVKRDSNRVNWEIIERLAKALDISAASLNGNAQSTIEVHYTDGTIAEITCSSGIDGALSEIEKTKEVKQIVFLDSDFSEENNHQWLIEQLPDGRYRLVPGKDECGNPAEMQEDEISSDKEGILQRSAVSSDKAMSELTDTVRSICKDDRAISEAQRLHEAELMPARIGLVTDFIRRNADFLKGNMPGMVPDPTEKK